MPELLPEQLEILLSTGITVEADLWKPQRTASPEQGSKVAICLHPWSWLGGQKGDPVLMSLVESLLLREYYVLSYNSRGNGRSTGWTSLTGFKEAEDLKAVVQWAVDEFSDVHSVVILGYSYGSLIASMHPILPVIKTSHILLSYPLGPRGWLTMFNSSSYDSALQELVKHPDSNVLVIYGDKDEFTSVAKYKSWTSKLAGSEDRLSIHEVKHASHFWRGQSGRDLERIVSQWLP